MAIWQRNDAVRERAREIAGVFIKSGFGFLVKDLGLRRFMAFGVLSGAGDLEKTLKSEEFRCLVQRLPGMLEELGPTFIKLGQFLSSRPDLVPDFVTDALKSLQEQVTPVAFERIEQLVAENLPEYKNIFTYIDPQPLGVASIAQTHAATLADRRKVVLKVRKPEVINKIELDLRVMQKIVTFLAKQPEVNNLMDIENSFAIFAHSLKKEFDLSVEAGNIQLFRNLLADAGLARAPRVEWELSNENLLTMEYIEGISIEQAAETQNPAVRKELSRKFLDSFLRQVILCGVFHGDPHSGNIRLTKAGEIVYLDFGIVGRIDSRMTERLIENFTAIQNSDVDKLMNVALEMGHSTGETNWQNYYEDMAELMFVSQNMSQGNVEIGKMIFGMMHISQKHGIRMPERLLLLGKAFALAEGNARKIDPDVNFLEIARPIIATFLQSNVLPQVSEAAMLGNILDVKKKLRILFSELPTFISGMTRGEKKIPLSISGMEFLGDKLDKSINRIAYSLIISSMLLTSAIMMHSGTGPLQAKIHYTGYYLLVVSLIGTVYMFFKIFRQVKH
ncbi:ABC1 kinase family protein [Sporomusa malonica]|uniref:2-octaprenylphenol hydroxylase n=1 Tax=Sporomusa malonica TaxID=112901 RepID=A0A1W1Z6I7_9FIRM|nr:AarF/UbiB family protein [Sporomusa malonica]SMC43986.1 2-octaprenylphenol hydroxylase [Sporomusa malonica]